jgi:hypothetical protein
VSRCAAPPPRQLERGLFPLRGFSIPAGTFAPQLEAQIERWVQHGDRLAPGLAPLFDAIETGEVRDDRTNPDGTRTLTLAHPGGDVRVVMTRTGPFWRITALEPPLVIPSVSEG